MSTEPTERTGTGYARRDITFDGPGAPVTMSDEMADWLLHGRDTDERIRAAVVKALRDVATDWLHPVTRETVARRADAIENGSDW